MRYVLALDQGTTSSRAILFDERGAIRSVAQREFRQIFPQPGWVEHDPKEILDTQRACAREAVRASGIALKDLMAVGITNQRETTLLWDRQSGQPLHFIQNITVKLNGKAVVEAEVSQAVSRNPVFSFRIKGGAKGDKIEVSWLDNKGESNRIEGTVA